MTPQKRNYNRKIRGRNQAVNQEAKSPVKRPSAKKPAQFDLNETFISFTPKKRLQKEARQFIDRLNSNINVFHHNIPESPEVTPITCLESPQSSYHKMPESFPSFILPPVIPRVELTRSSTPSSEGQNYSSFFRENFEVEDMFMYAEWKKDIESTYFVYNHNERRRSSPEAVNDTLVGNTSPKNFPRKFFFVHLEINKFINFCCRIHAYRSSSLLSEASAKAHSNGLHPSFLLPALHATTSYAPSASNASQHHGSQQPFYIHERSNATSKRIRTWQYASILPCGHEAVHSISILVRSTYASALAPSSTHCHRRTSIYTSSISVSRSRAKLFLLICSKF